MNSPRSLEVFQDLTLTSTSGGTSAVREALLSVIRSPWRHAQAREAEGRRYSTEEMIALERDASNGFPAIGFFLVASTPQAYRVANIVPRESGELGIRLYNHILQNFVASFEAAFAGANIAISVTSPQQSLADWMSEGSARLLQRFSSCANKSTGTGHPLDRERWIEFLISAHGDPRDSGDLLLRWLTEVEGWPEDGAFELVRDYELARDLLRTYDSQR